MSRKRSRTILVACNLVLLAIMLLAAPLTVSAKPQEPGGGGCGDGEWVVNWWATCTDGTFCRYTTYNTCTGETRCDGPIFAICPK